jgi:phosphoenolpyruvate synthase/pyruvate phosphate dikinase
MIKFFNEITKDDIAEVGGKAASLGEMTKMGMPIPKGFVITTEAYRQLHVAGPQALEEGILKAFQELGAKRVAVRSSAIAEDGQNASWAGQLESYLNITQERLLDYIQECWQSIESERAISYAEDKGLEVDDLAVAVIVQEMVDSYSSGVMFTKNPITNNTKEIMVESIFGLGELIVQGMISPDNFVINKEDLVVKSANTEKKEVMLVYQNFANQEVAVPKELQDEPSITGQQLHELCELGIKIEKHYGVPMDIEWAIQEGKILILQARPVTT